MVSTWAKRVGWGVGGAILVVAAYLAAWPVPIQPVAWTAPAAPGYQGVHAPNQRLAQLNIIDLKGEVGPEHIAFGKDGKLYTTVLSGNILRMNADGSGQEVFANTGGRVLGFDFDAAGNLIAADAVKGLLSIAPDGKVTLLADKVGMVDSPLISRFNFQATLTRCRVGMATVPALRELTPAQRAAFEAGESGELAPLMCVDKDPAVLPDLSAAVQRLAAAQRPVRARRSRHLCGASMV